MNRPYHPHTAPTPPPPPHHLSPCHPVTLSPRHPITPSPHHPATLSPLTTLHDLTGDFVVYRNLEPYDPRVPGLSAAWRDMGLPGPAILRKRDPAYPHAAAWILRRFHDLHAPDLPPTELLLIGDTLGSDGGAFKTLVGATGWAGSAFIGAEDLSRAGQADWRGDLYVANRWEALADWLGHITARGLSLDARTIVVVDIDKTALGARGRNDRPIDATRLDGMHHTVLSALGPDADWDAFAAIYEELNRPTYKELTADNQDYLAYICIMAGAGMMPLDRLQDAYRSGDIPDFDTFISRVQTQAHTLPPALATIHQAVYNAHRANDPTPFKDFRRQEYLAAVARLGNLPDDAPLAARLADEICLTQEVWDACRWLQARGALVTSLSDKPDEACGPTPDMAAQGYRPIHRTPTHLIGTPLALF